MGRLALKIWENQYETIKKIPKKSQREKLALAILDYAFTGKHEKLEYPLDVIIQSMYIGLTLKNQGGAPTGNKNNRYTTVVQPLYNPCDNLDTTSEQPLLEIRNKKIENRKEEEIYKEEFEEFWKLYTPVKCNRRFVDKGSKKTAYEKYVKLLKKGESHENIIRGTREYINRCQANNQLTCGATVFLNQERWKCCNEDTVDGNSSKEYGQPRSILETYTEIARDYQQADNLY